MSKAYAKLTLDSLELGASFMGDSDGIVVSQNPSKDASIKKGSTITAVIHNKRE